MCFLWSYHLHPLTLQTSPLLPAPYIIHLPSIPPLKYTIHRSKHFEPSHTIQTNDEPMRKPTIKKQILLTTAQIPFQLHEIIQPPLSSFGVQNALSSLFITMFTTPWNLPNQPLCNLFSHSSTRLQATHCWFLSTNSLCIKVKTNRLFKHFKM